MIPEGLKFTKSDEWVKLDGDTASIGITDVAITELSDIVFIEFPNVGSKVSQNAPFGVIESVKAVFDLNSPVSGEVIAINEDVSNNLELLKEDAYNNGWLIKVKVSDKNELNNLMDLNEYQNMPREHH